MCSGSWVSAAGYGHHCFTITRILTDTQTGNRAAREFFYYPAIGCAAREGEKIPLVQCPWRFFAFGSLLSRFLSSFPRMAGIQIFPVCCRLAALARTAHLAGMTFK
jgi:hypothetical protein